MWELSGGMFEMRAIIILVAAMVGGDSCVLPALGSFPQSPNRIASPQSDLEKKVQMIFLRLQCSESGPVYDRVAELRKLGDESGVRAILASMLKRYRHAAEGTTGYLYFVDSVWTAGPLGIAEVSDELRRVLFDPAVQTYVKEMAVKSLAQINLEENKQVLIRALNTNRSRNDLMRVAAAEALELTEDPEILKQIERQARRERDAFYKQRMQASANRLRTRIAEKQ
jgi:hypothetical protein